MRVNTGPTAGVSASTMPALMLAVFTVSVGFGAVLPLLPYLSLGLPHLLVLPNASRPGPLPAKSLT